MAGKSAPSKLPLTPPLPAGDVGDKEFKLVRALLLLLEGEGDESVGPLLYRGGVSVNELFFDLGGDASRPIVRNSMSKLNKSAMRRAAAAINVGSRVAKKTAAFSQTGYKTSVFALCSRYGPRARAVVRKTHELFIMSKGLCDG